MSTRDLSARLEEAARLLPGEPADQREEFCRIESVALAMLEAEHQRYSPGELHELIYAYLRLCRIELGLIAFPDSHES